MKMIWIRFLNRLGLRKDTLTCIRQEFTYVWPSDLGKKTPGKCSNCESPIFFEKQNGVFKNKICDGCAYPRL